jgi:hypothetical protein
MEEEQGIVSIKVSDVIDFSESDYRNTKIQIKKMNAMVGEYVMNIDNPDELELLKRRFNGELMYLNTLYSKILCFRENFQYLESQRKELKALSMQKMMLEDSSIRVTNAEKTVYAYPYYMERVKLIEQLKRFFYLVELQYKNYENTQRSIYQSISTLSKERQSIIS